MAIVTRKFESGLGLIEVLVALLVLAVGLLALSALQMQALAGNKSAHQRALATLAAYELSDRVRANPRGAEAGDYVWEPTAYSAGSPGFGADCVANACISPAAVAEHDLREWVLRLRALPTGWGRVTRDGNLYTVTVMWDDDRSGATGTDCGEGDLMCFQVTFRP